ncbi:MAG: DUF1934 domain-containing protein [Clostridia bacterium]|nr:DUF1934 domain-containing protein [Clostridia bacterium]
MEKKKQVLINLLAIAKYDHTPDFPIQMMTKGKLHIGSSGDAVLEYTESQQDEETGEVSTANITLEMKKNRVIMNRVGDFSNTMVFMPEQRFEGIYHTPYGNMDMAVFARSVRCDIGESKGSVHLNYQLHIQGAYASTNELHLEYTTYGE